MRKVIISMGGGLRDYSQSHLQGDWEQQALLHHPMWLPSDLMAQGTCTGHKLVFAGQCFFFHMTFWSVPQLQRFLLMWRCSMIMKHGRGWEMHFSLCLLHLLPIPQQPRRSVIIFSHTSVRGSTFCGGRRGPFLHFYPL